MRNKVIGILCIIAAVSMMIFAGIKYYPKLMDYKKSKDLYNHLEDKYTTPLGDIKKEAEELGLGSEESLLSDLEEMLTEDETEDIAVKTESETEAGTESIEELSETELGTEPETEKDGYKESKKKAAVRRNNLLLQIKTLKKLFKELGIKRNVLDYLCIDVDGKNLKMQNEDYVGWIYIPKTGISYPVVQGKDNNEYLHANFQKEYNFPGTIFVDSNCKNVFLDHHAILYGHNMRDGSMFYHTKSFLDPQYLEAHPVIWIITPEYKLLYRIFSVFVSPPDDLETFSYQGVDFKTNEEWERILLSLQNRSSVKVEQELSPLDFCITLSTCTDARTTRVATSAVLLGAFTNASEEFEKKEK